MKPTWISRFPWRGATTQLFVLIVLPLSILILVVSFGGLSLHRQAMRIMVGERDERAVRAAASAISEQLNHREKAIQALALLAGDTLSQEELQTVLSDSDFLFSDFDRGLAFFMRGGRLLAFNGESNIWAEVDVSLPILEEALARDVPPSFLMIPDPNTGEPVMVTLAISTKGGPIAAGAFNPTNLVRQALAGVFIAEEGSVIYLADADGHLLYQSGASLDSLAPEKHPGILEALTGNSGTDYVPVDGEEHVVSYSPIRITGWALVIEEPWEAVTPPLLRTTEYAPFVLIPAFLLTLVALWFGVRQIVQPLQVLESQAAELGWGNYTAIEDSVGGIAEIQHLQNELIHLAHKVKAAQAGLRGYIGAITTRQEEERRRLSRELHDDTLQALIALNQRIQLARLSQQDPVLTASLVEIQDLTTRTMENLRRLTRALRPIYLEDLGLVAALEVLAKEIQQSSHIPIRFQHIGEPRRLPSQTELAFYRMAQEALNNIIRHAQASQAHLKIEFVPTSVHLYILDDGKGFIPPESPAELAPQGHYGLLGLHERAELIGATLNIQTSPGTGTRIEISLKEL